MLKEHPDVEIAGEARNAADAEDMLEKYDPDLVFLDIQMPGRSGLELLETCPILRRRFSLRPSIGTPCVVLS